MILNVNLLLCRRCYVYRGVMAEARITQFSLKSSTISISQLSAY